MTKEDLIKNLLEIIFKHTQVEIKPQDFDTPLVDLGLDSVYAVEIANEMEDLLGITIDDRDIATLKTVNIMLKYFEQHIQK